MTDLIFNIIIAGLSTITLVIIGFAFTSWVGALIEIWKEYKEDK